MLSLAPTSPRDFKPKPGVYLAAADAFDLPPQECMMVAAHTKDFMAAAALGLRTGHIARPNEHGPGRGETAPSACRFCREQP